MYLIRIHDGDILNVGAPIGINTSMKFLAFKKKPEHIRTWRDMCYIFHLLKQ